jgi:uncharacterized protein YdhG (YjbR/CyaY superfamily)
VSVVDDYLETLGTPEKAALEHIRAIIHKMVPEAEEVKTYGMPGFKYRGKYLASFAAFKDHLSLFPGAEPVEVFRDKLRGYTTSKGTIQFTLDNSLPDELLADIIRAAAARNDRR